jgi:DNA polymerase III subunit gamma/tau
MAKPALTSGSEARIPAPDARASTLQQGPQGGSTAGEAPRWAAASAAQPTAAAAAMATGATPQIPAPMLAALDPVPFPAASAPPATNGAAAPLTDGALAISPEAATAVAGALSPASLRQAIVAVLATAGRASAAQLLGSGTWTLEDSSVRVTVPVMSKKMVSLTVDAAVEKMIRQELQRLGAPARFQVMPGAGAAAEVAPPAVLAGSVQEAALANPLVKRAQEIFKAEVRSVVDLRQK